MTIEWRKIAPDNLPEDWQDVLVGWDRPRHHWPTGPRVMTVTFRDFRQEYQDDDGPQMFGTYGLGDLHCPSHWAPLPPPPPKERA